jgi:hypothetical protein
MNETSIKPINSIRPAESGGPTPVKPPVTGTTESTAPYKPAMPEQEPAVRPPKLDSEQGNSPSNVSIHFRLDDKTHELTVFVVDRKTKRVIRSIPASELDKLQAGDLLKLTA